MLEKGFMSGCLTVISNDFQANYQSLLQSVEPLAVKEWNKFEADFITYYKLDKTEHGLFDHKSTMPSSFIEKYFLAQLEKNSQDLLNQLPNVLYHKKNPNTQSDLVNDLINRKVYKVKCNICNRAFFMDVFSIICVKWRSCTGAPCLSSTVDNETSSYANLCKVDNQSNALQTLSTQLSSLESISNPLSYYGGSDDLHISYISDIHLLHHVKNTSLQFLINTTIRNLYETMDGSGPIIFGGDTSSNAALTIEFYKRFVQYHDYLTYMQEKEFLFNMKNKKVYICANKQKLGSKIVLLKKYIDKTKELLPPYLNFKVVEQYKNRYYKFSRWVEAINAYKNTNSYKNKGISDECDGHLNIIASKLDLLESFESEYAKCLVDFDHTKQQIIGIETTYGKTIEELTVSDVYTKHHLLSEEREIFVVLGNHEYIGFNKVDDAIEYFKPRLKELGVKLLHNNYYEYTFGDKSCVIFGGSGFAKYNPKYNADILVCCNDFTRQDEFEETALFEKAYLKAKNFASDKSCFVCVSHYPISDCSTSIDKDTIYFYGHNHQNYHHRNENEIIYADNQIGYDHPDIAFKIMTTGVELNPYYSLEDGLYKTTIKDYLQFYRHIGESIGDGALLYQRCKNPKANMYVIKRKGYYGFFIMNSNKGASQGISIVNGGTTKKITKSTNLQWLFDNFETVLCKYLQMLIPLRRRQEQISDELKQLGFWGRIHGCIVDVDFNHHIMLNPNDGTMTYYYSSSFGLIQPLVSFSDVIKSIQSHDICSFSSKREYTLLLQEFNEKRQNQNYLLGKVNETYLLGEADNDIVASIYMDEQAVSCSEGLYGISRRVNPLQRLFSSRTLRGFDMRLVETEPLEN